MSAPARQSFSQQGEDMILASLFQGYGPGFYIDVGAYDPWLYSNTAWLYLNGWRGINIEPRPGAQMLFDRERPHDQNLELGVSSRGPERLQYHVFRAPAVNGFGYTPERVAELSPFGYLRTTTVECRTLEEIYEAWWRTMPVGAACDVLFVDAEGMDLDVLRSNNWNACRPKAIVAEDLGAFTLDEVARSPVTALLWTKGYAPISKCHHSIIYGRTDLISDHNFHPRGRP